MYADEESTVEENKATFKTLNLNRVSKICKVVTENSACNFIQQSDGVSPCDMKWLGQCA